MSNHWSVKPLSDFVVSRPGNNKLIKGKQSNLPGDGLFQGFSASGPDIWVTSADYSQPGVVISAVGARCGKTFIADGRWTAIANTHVILPKDTINLRWLWYRTNDEQFWIRGGSAQPFVRVKETLMKPIKIPPLPEQERIVRLLDEAFTGIEIAKANAEKNIQNARAVFESYLESVFTNLEDGFKLSDLRSLTSKIGSGATPRGGKNSYHKFGISLIRSLNIYDNGFRYDGLAYLDEKQAEALSNVIVEEGDVLLNITGASIARCCVVPKDVLPARVNQHVSIIRTIKEKVDPLFLHFLLISSPYKKKLLGIGEEGGSTRQAITKRQIEEFEIKFPTSLNTQRDMVRKTEIVSYELSKLQKLFEEQIASLAELKSAFLNDAFRGNL